MTLTIDLDLDIPKVYLLNQKTQFPGKGFQKLEFEQTHRQTGATERITTPLH